MHINRYLLNEIIKKTEPNKVVVVYGPRQVGKTTLVKELLKLIDPEKKALVVSGEDRNVSSWLGSQSITTLKQYIGDKTLLVIDEAQKIENIGLNLKLIVDHINGIRVIATGSSSFELANQVGEPLVGRKWQFTLYPIAQIELSQYEARHETEAILPFRLLYGSYPAVITAKNSKDKIKMLSEIVDGYLFKDMFAYDEIRKSQKIIDILRLLAFQIGHDVSLNEIGTQVHLDLRTVERYIDLFEKVFAIKKVYGFSRNQRKEITKNCRYYFWDLGIRNALINNFNPIEMRNDIGMLWENYLFIERLKKQEYFHLYANNYFWRTYDQKEIDHVEEREGQLFGYEYKWGQAKSKNAKAWLSSYENNNFEIINQENYLTFIS